ncbi:tRNA pseudouridine(38-40) synthase TruA [Pedobacter sp. JY14-1]|uniref:tRNA pseudouridine(38-40) synthase TruA n=1 Tax=Pedobacter sp. JY14-1 TaxID=3034151 RepID=UPI0023E14100|nr:tRNA pseudouridine(38-40) synthase TruA [Pedobacter sp. JY14-1]
MRYFVHIGYNGYRYNGWQKQPNLLNVQGIIEQKLTEALKTPVEIIGCGRTDTHVHASQFFFHMDIGEEWTYDLSFRLNKLLPPTIAVFDIIPVEAHRHARFDAVLRSYDYYLHTYKNPFLHHISSYYPYPELDFSKMQEAAALLPKYKDYRAFCTSPDKYEHTRCNVMSAQLHFDSSGQKMRFQISANRFLGKMIRIIMGELLKVGQHRLSTDEFEHYLNSRTTPKLLSPAHPEGLYLSKVSYPYLNLPPRTDFAQPFLII